MSAILDYMLDDESLREVNLIKWEIGERLSYNPSIEAKYGKIINFGFKVYSSPNQEEQLEKFRRELKRYFQLSGFNILKLPVLKIDKKLAFELIDKIEKIEGDEVTEHEKWGKAYNIFWIHSLASVYVKRGIDDYVYVLYNLNKKLDEPSVNQLKDKYEEASDEVRFNVDKRKFKKKDVDDYTTIKVKVPANGCGYYILKSLEGEIAKVTDYVG